MTTKERVARADLYEAPLAGTWTDGLFSGNGNMAVLLHGVRELTYTLNKTDVYQNVPWKAKTLTDDEVCARVERGEVRDTFFLDDEEREPDTERAPFHTVSPVQIRLKGYDGFGWATPPVPRYAGRVSLYDATLYARAEDGGLPCRTSAFTPYGSNGFCLRLQDLGWSHHTVYAWDVVRPTDGRLDLPSFSLTGNELVMTQRFEEEDAYYAVVCRFVAADGAMPRLAFNSGTAVQIKTAGDATLYVCIRTSRESANYVENARRECADMEREGFDRLHAAHASWWERYWARSSVFMDSEPEMEKRFLFSQYVMACTFAAAPMPSLSGLAYGPLDALFAGCNFPFYTHDQNVQIALAGAMPTGHAEMVQTMADTYLGLTDTLHAFTSATFGTRGICLPLSMSTTGSWMRGAYRYTLCGSAYSGMTFVHAWRYGRDRDALRDKYYPLLKEFCRFYMDRMRLGKDGRYHLAWSVPPEIFTLTRDEVCTLALLRPCLETCVEAAKMFQSDADFCAECEDVLAHYPTLCRRSDGGWWCGPDIPETQGMYGGHLLYPFFPSETDTDRDAAQKTLEWFDKNALELDGYGDPGCGWSAFNRTVTLLRLGGREAFENVRTFLRLFGKENGLFHHNSLHLDDTAHINPDAARLQPPVIEGTSAYLFMVCESLLQTRDGIITLFANVPEHFTGGFSGLRTRDGYTVSARMEDGKTVFFDVRAPHETVCRVNDGNGVHEYVARPVTDGQVL